ncbi:unnamed protein product [Ostreobium quekettii]|uniref:Uncharacterized protein n=1 Tax=Ostreobium quekettii TaxID=121088 RepID=A0A8S1IZU6_9CHLO|nr:unnamed protein product [Ostreobium quekettii]
MRTERVQPDAVCRNLPARRASIKPTPGNRLASVSVRAKQPELVDSKQAVASRRPILIGVLGTCASLACVGGAQALTRAEVDKRKATIENQEAMLEYMLEQQRTLSKAKAAAKEQQIESEASQIENRITQQITADRVDPSKAEEVPKLESAIEEVQAAEAKAEAQVIREEILEEAKRVGVEQDIRLEAAKEEDEISKAVDAFVANMSSMQ